MTSEPSKGLNRNRIDKFYTHTKTVKFCLQIIKQNLSINPAKDLIIEPSAGNGAFIAGIKQLCKNYIFYDLAPENHEIIKQDYLLFDKNTLVGKYEKIHIIGNPPFGRQSSLAIKFY